MEETFFFIFLGNFSKKKVVWFDTFVCLRPVVAVPGDDPAEMVDVGGSGLHQQVAVRPARPVSLKRGIFVKLSGSN